MKWDKTSIWTIQNDQGTCNVLLYKENGEEPFTLLTFFYCVLNWVPLHRKCIELESIVCPQYSTVKGKSGVIVLGYCILPSYKRFIQTTTFAHDRYTINWLIIGYRENITCPSVAFTLVPAALVQMQANRLVIFHGIQWLIYIYTYHSVNSCFYIGVKTSQ